MLVAPLKPDSFGTFLAGTRKVHIFTIQHLQVLLSCRRAQEMNTLQVLKADSVAMLAYLHSLCYYEKQTGKLEFDEGVSTMEPKLYIVDYPRKSDFAEAAIIPVEYDYTRFVKCPQCGERVSGAYWEHPRKVVLTRHKAPDFLYAYCDNAPFVLLEKAMEEITQAGLKGIDCFEEIECVQFQRKSKKELTIPRYFHVELARSCITINHQQSVIKYGASKNLIACPMCRQVPATYDFFRSLAFHTSDYEGFDIFQIYELGNTVFLSERFVKFYENSKLTNLHYGPAQKHDTWAASYFLDGNEDA